MFASSTSPRARYSAHKQRSREQGVPFTISFADWWDAWAPHWPHRGTGGSSPDSLVMVRREPAAGFAPGNVSIVTQRALGASGCTGPRVRGSDVATAKLTEADIPRIRDMLRCGVLARCIAEQFGVHRTTIRTIKNGRAWKHVA